MLRDKKLNKTKMNYITLQSIKITYNVFFNCTDIFNRNTRRPNFQIGLVFPGLLTQH